VNSSFEAEVPVNAHPSASAVLGITEVGHLTCQLTCDARTTEVNLTAVIAHIALKRRKTDA